MTRRIGTWAAVAALIVVVVVAGAVWAQTLAAQSAGRLTLAGDVRAQSVTVNSPAIVYPTIVTSIGIPATATAAPSASRGAPGASASRLPVLSGFVKTVCAPLGSRVTTGQPLVQLDTTMLDLGVEQARANAKRAHAQIAVLNSALDSLGDAAGTLATARGQLATAGAKLNTALAQALAGRAQLVAAIAVLKQMIAHLPPNTPPPTSTPPGGGAPNPKVVLAQLEAKLAQLDAGLALLQKGLGQLATGRVQLATASSQLSSAHAQLRTAHDVATIAVQASDLGVSVAEVERSQARILSPVSGVVTYVLSAGSVAMVGTPLDTIAPDRPVLVDTYVADSQMSAVKIGQAADLTYDSDPEAVLHGRVTMMGASSTFPPTSFPTDLIHLTRALRVTITLDRGPAPPPGSPVDLVIHTNG
jgi:multidrug resistance efflux pump